MNDAAADWLQTLIRDFQDTLTCGLYEAIYQLDGPTLETLMQAQGHTCAGAFLQLGTLPPGPLALDDFLQVIGTAGPSRIEIRRDGDVIEWIEQHEGACVCPFVKRGVIRLDAKLCLCGAHWVKALFRTVARTEIDIETVETVATGAQNCHFRIRVLGPSAARPPLPALAGRGQG